ncbi:acetyltransferase [Methylicorpusculum oleiharenae]|uniref:GNAT family N-acetyltransferase n=1 Tax=Methylicorpusculum oleiharenae TaxID=1338687 RepID=UPI0019CFA1E3|nr:GNAT family N-acetyltransferase [Methylicorpusculum oleiharenae]MCD2453713.1 acetyltransferase [Methylicorpusculum oleiharenae]
MNPNILKQTLPDGRHVDLQHAEAELLMTVDEQHSALFQLTSSLENLSALQLIELAGVDRDSSVPVLVAALHVLFDSQPQLLEIELSLAGHGELIAALVASGAATRSGEVSESVISRRGMLRQMVELYLSQSSACAFPLHYTVTDGKRHPLRAPVAIGEVYRRYLPEQGLSLSLRTVDPETDLDTFHAWHNNPRVSAFWELEGSKDMHREYLQKVTTDAHMHPVFGCFDGEPFGYFEIYWAKEDRIAPYYEVDDYDRGVHMLVGEERWRGPQRVAAWLPSLAHFMFLDDPRTRNVVAEPRADNAKMIGYMQQAGFCKPKEFDFPHKRAALMMLSREAFFDQFCV